MSSIIEIRSFSTDDSILKISNFCFEFETADRVFALGCRSLEEKQSWLTALGVARDRALVFASDSQSSLKSAMNIELSVEQVRSCLGELIKVRLVSVPPRY